jgi:DivIVA domain-containing protein
MREGYAIGEVDEFLTQVAAALEFDPPLMRAEDVESQRFAPVRVRSGYDMDEVDAHLDRLAAELRRRTPAEVEPPVRPAAADPSAVPSRRPVWPVLLVIVVVVVVAALAGFLLG